MSLLDETVEIPRRTMTLFFLIGTSGSMDGHKIGAVNESMRELLPNISDISAANPDAEINVAVLQFSKGASWIYKEPKPASDFEWNDLSAAGASADLGEACRELNSKLSKNGFMKSASDSYAPIIILLSDSNPTDDFETGLAELKKNGWFRVAIKIAIAIGDDANKEKLAKFTGTSETVFSVHNIDALKKMIRIVAVTSSQVDEKRTMKAIFSRCRGASHEISGKVCQDYCQAEVTDSYTIGAVSDGHGGDRYFRSDVGSKSAVEATLECVREFVQTADESLFSGAPLTQCGTVAAEREKNGSGMGDERYALFRQLFSSIICKWHERILEDAKRPATPEERAKVPQEQIEAFESTDSFGNRTGIEQTYGCTLMCFARTKSYWFAFHIGNGKCVALSVDSGRIENSEPVPWDEKCFRNVTTSLCDPEALDKFRYCYGGKDTLPLAVFLGSDGIDDSIPDPADMANFYVNILKLLGRYSEADAKKELDDTLPALSRRGSKDDMSVVCCYDDEALKSEVNTLVEWQRGNVRTEMQAVRERLDELTRKLSASLKLLAPVTDAIVQQRKCWQADIEKARKELDRLAFREAKLSAELGEVKAERNLVRMYEEGRGEEKDLEKALQWYRTAADEHDDTVSQRNLGRMFEHGIGTEENPSEAFGWYQKAADKGDPVSLRNIARLYETGKGVEANLFEALSWYRKAAEQNDHEAQRNLARMYENGLGTENSGKNIAEAVKWYRSAADLNDAESQRIIATKYETGEWAEFGIEKNDAEAVSWYRKAAENGSTDAQYRLARMYENGLTDRNNTKKLSETVKAGDSVKHRNKPEVKLHDVMKQLLRQFGSAVLQDERLLSLLDDYHAFEDFPAMRQVMKEFASRGYLRDLYCRSQKDGIAECQLYADYVKKSLAQTRHFRAEFADYAVDSVFFALGLTDSVSEPSDHGFDPAAEYADW